jgi:hypothetical protein
MAKYWIPYGALQFGAEWRKRETFALGNFNLNRGAEPLLERVAWTSRMPPAVCVDYCSLSSVSTCRTIRVVVIASYDPGSQEALHTSRRWVHRQMRTQLLRGDRSLEPSNSANLSAQYAAAQITPTLQPHLRRIFGVIVRGQLP